MSWRRSNLLLTLFWFVCQINMLGTTLTCQNVFASDGQKNWQNWPASCWNTLGLLCPFQANTSFTWYIQSLCRFRQCCSIDHMGKLNDSISNGHFLYACITPQVRLPHAGKIDLRIAKPLKWLGLCQVIIWRSIELFQTLYKSRKSPSFNLKLSGNFWVWTFLVWRHDWGRSRNFWRTSSGSAKKVIAWSSRKSASWALDWPSSVSGWQVMAKKLCN